MTLKNKLKKVCSSNLLYLFANIFLGVALINDLFILGFLCLSIMFYWFKVFVQHRLDSKNVLAIFIGNILFMITAVSWFRNIDPHGWGNIAGLPPSFFLSLSVLAVSIFCSAISTFLWIAIHSILRTNNLNVNKPLMPVVWASSFMISELLVSTSFSIATYHANAPIMPTWNLFSVALLSVNSPLLYFGKLLGFWGLTWFICLLVGIFVNLLVNIKKLKLQDLVLPTLVVVSLFFATTLFSSGATDSKNVAVVAVAKNDNDYLKKLAPELKPINGEPMIVVLPEYSSLLHPYGASPVDLGYDARYEYPDRFENDDIYFVGTENEQFGGKNYVETYVADGSLQKTKRQVKTFLIPGGEYMMGWTTKFINIFDKAAVNSFDTTRSRIVIKDNPVPDYGDITNRMIGVAACSTLLIPYHFRNEVDRGALLLTSNVAYDQFTNAPEYERFATRFAKFHASSLSRWMAIGASNGNAVIMNPKGETVQSKQDGIIRENIVATNQMTPYVRLGDKIIVLTITLLTAIFVLVSKRRTLSQPIEKLSPTIRK